MWILRVNNVDITIPVNEDVFFVSTVNDTELKSTDFDLYYTYEEFEALQLKGIIEEEDGINYRFPTIKGQLSNPTDFNNINVDCEVTVNYVSLTKKMVNLTVTANINPASQRFNSLYHTLRPLINPEGSLDRNLYPVGVDYHDYNTTTIYPWAGWAGNEGSFFVAGNLPVFDDNEWKTMLNRMGWHMNIDTPIIYPYVSANTIYADGSIKIRRARWHCDVIWNGDAPNEGYENDNAYLVKGEYAGISNDVFKGFFDYVDNQEASIWEYEARLENTFRLDSATTGIKTYFGADVTAHSGTKHVTRFSLTITCDVPFIVNYYIYGQSLTSSSTPTSGNPNKHSVLIPLLTPFIITGYTLCKNNNFEIVPQSGSLTGEVKYTMQYIIPSDTRQGGYITIDIQQHFKDSYNGFKKVVGNVGDTKIVKQKYGGYPLTNLRFQEIFTTKCFDSRGWGCNIFGDYNGTIRVDDLVDTGYDEDKYNVPVGDFAPLMYTDKYLCLDASIYDLVWNLGYKIGRIAQIDAVNHSVDFTVKPTLITNITDYITDEKFYLDDEKKVMYWTDQNGNKYYDIEQGDEKGSEFYKSEYINTNQIKAAIDYTSDGTPTILTSGCLAPIKPDTNSATMKELTILHDFTELASGDPRSIYWNKNQTCMWLNGTGFFMWWNNATLTNPNAISIDDDIRPTTTLDKGIIMRVTLPEYIPTSYVNVQTRTFYVLSQQLADDGTNEVELLLYC